MTLAAARSPRSARLFAICYVAAMFGAFVAFMPLGALILPQKIAAIEGSGGNAVRALSWLLVAGGIMAGIGNIVAGHLSDRLYRRVGSRRGMIALGLGTVVVTLAMLAVANSFSELVAAVLALQLALNLLLSPLFALMVDYVPDWRKGRMAGWLGLALPVGSLSLTLLVSLPAIGAAGQLAVTAAIVVLLVAPLVLLWPVPEPIAQPDKQSLAPRNARHSGLVRNFALAWVARLLVQFAAAAILPYLYYYVADVARPGAGAAEVAQSVGVLALAFSAASIIGGLGVGWISDRVGQRQPMLVASAVMIAASMLLLANGQGWPGVVAAYSLFAAGLAGFLAVDGALVAQLVSLSERRATLLGVMNLTNTLPGVMAPATTLLIMGDGSGGAARMVLVLKLAAVGALAAALCGGRIRLDTSDSRGQTT